MADSKTIKLPDVGDFSDIEIIEVLVAPGDKVEAEQGLIVLESDKATMEIPSPEAGTIEKLVVSVGDRVNKGDDIAVISPSGGGHAGGDKDAGKQEDAKDDEQKAQAKDAAKREEKSGDKDEAAGKAETEPAKAAAETAAATLGKTRRPHPGDSGGGERSTRMIHASPSIRRYARELGVDLQQVVGSGPKGRLLKTDVKAFVKSAMTGGGAAAAGGVAVAAIPDVDHSKFGEIESRPLSRIKKISGAHLHRSWVNVPHVTQFDEADVTDLEAFRKSLAKEAEQKGVRLTPLIFLMKAVVSALEQFPDFNASLDSAGENLILKKYFHIGIAVDTPNGLVVPVVRDVDQKGIYDLAGELGETSKRARDGKLSPTDMQGGCFTISSLGGIGGTYFTPIVNAPEVAILGVSRSKMQPVYRDGEFVPRMILPFGLSYDHRVIDGAQAARFTSYLGQVITDIRRVLL